MNNWGDQIALADAEASARRAQAATRSAQANATRARDDVQSWKEYARSLEASLERQTRHTARQAVLKDACLQALATLDPNHPLLNQAHRTKIADAGLAAKLSAMTGEADLATAGR